MICFWILSDFEEKSQKCKTGKIWALRAPTPQLREPMHDVDLSRSVGHPRRGEARVPKWHPSGMPRRSGATPWRRPPPRHSYCSQ